jgi:putative ABC transport system substrate-binding protein
MHSWFFSYYIKEDMIMKKKVVSMMLAAAMVFGLAACGSSDSGDSSGSTASAGGTESTADAGDAADAESTQTATDAGDAADTGSSDGQTYKIGICQLVQHDALDAATQGFEDALTEKLGDAVTFDFQNASGESANCATIVNGFVSDNVDLILANATAPLQAAASATDTIPILGTSITDYATALEISDWTGVVGNNISGTSDLAPLDQQAAMIQELFPDAQKVGLLYCSSEANSVYQCNEMESYLQDLGYETERYTFNDTNDVTSVTQSAADSVDVLYIPTDNTAASNTEAIANVVIPAGLPVIAGEEGICEGCGVATLSISYYDIGYKSGEMAYEILVNGADITTMAVEYAPNVTKEYNAANCETLGITIPDDYTAIGE